LIVLLIVIIVFKKVCEHYNKELNKLIKENVSLTYDRDKIYNQYWEMTLIASQHKRNAEHFLNLSQSAGPAFADEELVSAVKYAMKAAHPDNPNGNQEDFIKFRNLYNKIKS
jgi:hypothetical protein